MSMETCLTCDFCVASEKPGMAVCRRFPPKGFMVFQPEHQSRLEISGRKVMTPAQGAIMSQYIPVMLTNMACGEYKPISAEVEK
jgi:hypothetical protein